MNTVNPVYNFAITEEGEYTKVVYKKSPLSFKMAAPLCFFTAIPAALIVFRSAPESLVSGIFAWLIWMVVLAIGLMYLINLLRRQEEFKINASNIVVGANVYERKNVAEYFIKTPSGQEYTTTTIVTSGGSLSVPGAISNLSSGMVALSHETGQAIRRHMRNSAYRICMRYGAKNITLAKGLNETDALALFDKVSDILDNK
jgi:hypothetical protein